MNCSVLFFFVQFLRGIDISNAQLTGNFDAVDYCRLDILRISLFSFHLSLIVMKLLRTCRLYIYSVL